MDKMKLQLRLVHFFKSIRAKNSWTQKDLADILDCSISAIERLESKSSAENVVINSISSIQKYCTEIDHTATDLVSYVEGHEPPGKDILLHNALDKINSLDIKSQAKFIKLLDPLNFDDLEHALKIVELLKKMKKNKVFPELKKLLSILVEG